MPGYLDLIGDDELIGADFDDLLDDEDEFVGDDDEDYDDEDDEIGDDLDDLIEMVSGLLEDDEDDDDEIGARRRRRRRRSRTRGRRRRTRGRRASKASRAIRAIAKNRAALTRGKTVKTVPRYKGRVLMLGGAETQGPNAGQLVIATTVQQLCRIDRLFVQGIDAQGLSISPGSFTIGDIKVGTSSQLAALPPLPGIMFTQDATAQGTGLKLDTVQTGTDFSVIISTAPAGSTFTWGAYATALR